MKLMMPWKYYKDVADKIQKIPVYTNYKIQKIAVYTNDKIQKIAVYTNYKIPAYSVKGEKRAESDCNPCLAKEDPVFMSMFFFIIFLYT